MVHYLYQILVSAKCCISLNESLCIQVCVCMCVSVSWLSVKCPVRPWRVWMGWRSWSTRWLSPWKTAAAYPLAVNCWADWWVRQRGWWCSTLCICGSFTVQWPTEYIHSYVHICSNSWGITILKQQQEEEGSFKSLLFLKEVEWTFVELHSKRAKQNSPKQLKKTGTCFQM